MSYFVSPSAFQRSTEKGCVTGRKSSFKIRLKINLHFIRHILIGLRYSGDVLFTNYYVPWTLTSLVECFSAKKSILMDSGKNPWGILMLHLVTEVSCHLHQWAQMSRGKLHMAKWAGRSQESALWRHRKSVLMKLVCSGHSKDTAPRTSMPTTGTQSLCLSYVGKTTNLQVFKCFLFWCGRTGVTGEAAISSSD